MARLIALAGAAAGVAGLGLQLYILVTGPLGFAGGAWRFLAYFTILANILVTALFVFSALRTDFAARRARLWSAGVTYITIVGLVYVTLLQSLWDPQGLQLIADTLLHYVTPLLAIVFWVAGVPKSALLWVHPLAWTGVPLLYLVYALIRARFDGFYPYFFIDAPQIGWLNTLLWSGLMLGAFVAVGFVYVAAGKILARRKADQGPSTS